MKEGLNVGPSDKVVREKQAVGGCSRNVRSGPTAMSRTAGRLVVYMSGSAGTLPEIC